MSHHLDSPLARQDPRLNITDQYLFTAQGATVLLMNVNTSLAGAAPGFHPEGRYEFRIHLDGSETEEVAYRLMFAAADQAGDDMAQQAVVQPYMVSYLHGDVGDDQEGTVLASGRTGEPLTTDAGLQVWAGRVRDPFYLDLDELKAVIAAVQHGDDLDTTPWSQPTTSTFAGSTVYSIVIAVPHSDEVLRPGRRIGVWSTTKLATDAGGWHQVNRAGLPMMWPIFRDDSSHEASHANETHPSEDVAEYTKPIAELVASTVARSGSAADPDGYGAAVARRVLPDVLPYQVASSAGFTFASFNGRTLRDNAPEVMFSMATNTAVPTGLGPAMTGDLRSDVFPFIVPG